MNIKLEQTHFNQGLNRDELVLKITLILSSNIKNIIYFFKFVMASKFNIYNIFLQCFGSIRYPLNQYTTL